MKKIFISVSVFLLLALVPGSAGVAAVTPDLLCRVDIGNEASETEDHNLVGWGPIEPDAHSYPGQLVPVWGDITGKARVIWGYREDTPCATLTLDRHIADGAATMIRIAWLDGIIYDGVISDDSFTVEVKNHGVPDSEYQQVFTWTGEFSHEWKTADIDLTGLGLDLNGWIDVRLCATAPKWEHFPSDLGQVAFAWIELWGELPPNGEFKGCTPGYWKNHTENWPVDATTALWDDYFSVGDPSWTLLEAVNMKGGKDKALVRHAAAAILNALHPDKNYPLSVAEIQALVNGAYGTQDWESVKNLLDENNNLGCD